MISRVAAIATAAVSVFGIASADAGVGRWTLHRLPGAAREAGVPALALDPQHPQVVYATTDDEGFYKSSDGGRSWRTLIPDVPGFAVAVAPSDPQTVYFGGNPGGSTGCVSKSTNAGGSWRELGCGDNGEVVSIVVSPRSSQTVYVGIVDGDGIVTSTNGGRSWRSATRGLPARPSVTSLAIDPKKPQNLYAAVETGFKTTDGGRSWRALNAGLGTVRAFAVDPHAPEVVYAATSLGVFKSVDGGKRWQGFNTGLTDTYVRTLAIDPRNSKALYAGTYDTFHSGGVYRSTNGGRTWRAMNNGLTDLRIEALAVSSNGRVVYAGTPDGLFTTVVGR